MKTRFLLHEIYREAFRDLGHILIRNFFKAFAWFSFIMFLLGFYAFLFRALTGFAFD